MAYTVGSLFSGIGGIDLAFQRAGFEIAFQVEIDAYCNRILAKHWPDVTRYTDVRTVGAELPTVTVLAGGFPCTDISLAGKGAGIKVGTRSGLWFEFARLIGLLRPRVVFLENVAAITRRDGTIVLGDLAALGYDAQWGVVPASAVGAPHQRDRWWCVAYRNSQRQSTGGAWQGWDGLADDGSAVGNAHCAGRGEQRVAVAISAQQSTAERTGDALVADATSAGWEARRADSMGEDAPQTGSSTQSDRRATLSFLGRVFDGLPAELDSARRSARWPARPGEAQYAWEAPRTAVGIPHRSQRLKALGNAVVVPLVEAFAKAIRTALEESDRA